MSNLSPIFSAVKKYSGWLVAGVAVIVAGVFFFTLNANTFIASDNALPEKVDFNRHIRPLLSDKCFTCHGPDAKQRKAGLRLDTPEGAFAALEENPGQFAIVPGDPEASAVFHRIVNTDTTERMPPPESKLKLTERDIQMIKKWISQGAEYKRHWAFIPPEKTDLPKVDFKKWVKNEIDLFVLAHLEEIGLKPNPEADKERLLKRVSMDLTGLPPTLEMQDRFLADDSPEAYEKIVDELLSRKTYGEKMAIHWLDVARYADSHGYQDDGLRTMWPWRDWVIHAFNENYPYDQFITWQLAGDLLPQPSKEMLLATGFNRNHKITQEGGVIDEEYRIEYVTDRTNTFGKALLGLSFECAKCHDHKYDPISQKDYYSTFAFFNQVPEKGLVGTIDASFADPPNMKISDKDVAEYLRFINKKDTSPVMVMVMKDSVGIRSTHILNRGNYDSPTDKVSFSTPEKVMPFDTTRFEKNRLGLAKWLFSPENPLASRVFVNRIWQEIFGRGIVKTTGDFGMQGELPTHPELLDWLAVDFRENGWDIKRLMKTIVMSATYRQSSEVNREKLEKDPENLYLARAPRIRYPAEVVRDHVLASSGLLVSEIGGPSVKPYQPKGLWEAATSGRGLLMNYVQDHEEDLYRRGMYVFIKRTVPPPVMLMFDASNRDQCEVRRIGTNTPLQALVMLNDPHVLEASRVLAEKLMEKQLPVPQMVETAFRQIVCREPRKEELELLTAYFSEEKSAFTENKDDAEKLLKVGEYPFSTTTDKISLAALMQVIHTIYNMEESITKS
ncbi:MAG: PSD1 and planctomycete cytochrome C domain-containing protein [Bacteroidia bacterium]|nr:PSD1 and planctomycete cytochrome C domain-containing protein [Bacteroidia bacterium]